MNKMRKGDEVIVITGKDKGKTGKVISFSGDRVLVEGVNVVKKHVKANPQANEPGGVKDKTMPIHRSNIQVYDAAAKNGDTKGKGSRVGIRVLNDGQRVRYFKASDQVIKDEAVKE